MRTIASVMPAAAILSGGASILVSAQTHAHVIKYVNPADDPQREDQHPLTVVRKRP